jgi:hypothetical protein
LRTLSLKRITMPKVAVLATGFVAAVMVATITPMPAQATPRAADCTGCHAGSTTTTVTATPSVTAPAPGATYTVAITLTANAAGGDTGYGIVAVAPTPAPLVKVFGGMTGASALSYTATMIAPATAGTYSYTVWTNQGPTSAGQVGSKVYSITVGAVPTTPPTTIPPTTVPPTTIPPTTIPPTTIPPTTIPPTTIPPTTIPPTTPPVVLPPVTPLPVIRVGEGDLRPSSAVGTKHLGMYASYGDMSCKACHNGLKQPAPPIISGEGINMQRGISCVTCHNGRREFAIFVAKMVPAKATATTPAGTQIAYGRCSDCHTIASRGGDWGGSHESDD